MGLAHWIPTQLRAFGLDVVLVDGWASRGSSTFNPRGTVCHHTAGGPSGDIPSLGILVNGRSDLPGPLCHVGFGRSGRCYVIAAGRANHAGSGGWHGLSGNSSVLGIEAESTGRGDWTDIQRRLYPVVAAALISGSGRDPALCCYHKDWTSRKIDPHGLVEPSSAFRSQVARVLASGGQGVDWAAIAAYLESQEVPVNGLQESSGGTLFEVNIDAQVGGWRRAINTDTGRKRLENARQIPKVSDADLKAQRIPIDDIKKLWPNEIDSNGPKAA